MRNNISSDIFRSYKPINIFNFAAGRKPHFLKIVLYVVFLTVFAIGHSYAGTWRDLFDGENLNGWERSVKENRWSTTWKTENGLLFARIEKPKQVQIRAADFLQWKAHKLQLNKLVVVGEEMYCELFDRDDEGELCLFLGKRKPAPDFAEGYIFSPCSTKEMEFSEKGVYKVGETKASYLDRLKFTTEHLKVVFDTGKFRLITKDILLTEFFDANIVSIDVIGLIVLYRHSGEWSTASISTFSVSGRDIPNHNSLDVQLRNSQLTTTWGKLKRF